MASWLRRFMAAWLVLSFPLSSWVSFIGTSQPRMKEPKVRIAAKARGFGSPNKSEEVFDQKLGKEVVEEVMEDVARELFSMKKVMEKGPMKRDVRLPNNATVTLLGACHNSKVSARTVEEEIRRIQPSALMLEPCKDRLDSLIQGNGHREERTKSIMRPDEPESVRRAFAWYGDEIRRAFRAFMNISSPGNLLVLMDLKDKDLTDAVTVKEEIWLDPAIRSIRDINMAKNIFSVSLLGHESIVAVVGANHGDGVEEALRDLNRRYSEDDVAVGEQIWDSDGCTGFYITPSGCKNLQDQQKNLEKDVPTNKWKTRKGLPKAQRRNLEIKLAKRLAKVLTSLCHKPENFVEPCSWKDLQRLKRMGS